MDIFSSTAIQKQAEERLSDIRFQQLSVRSQPDHPKTDAQIKELAQQFESIFVQHLMKSMRNAIPKSGLLNSFSLDMYESMFDQELAGEVTLQKGIGLADMLYRDLRHLQDSLDQAEKRPEKI